MEGVALFNERRFWDAHEAWERGWRILPPAQKLHIQSMIQTAAVFHLLKLGRVDPARRLAKRALEKLAQAPSFFPRVEVPGVVTVLQKIVDEKEGGTADWAIDLKDLRAELLLSPRS